MSIATLNETKPSPWEQAVGGAPKVFKAILSMKRHIGAIGKHGKVDIKGGARYDFRAFDDVLDAVAPLMNEFGLLIVPVVVNKEERIEGNKHYAILTMSYRIYAEDGSFIEGSAVGESFDTGDKASTKAQTVALRIFYCSTFNIAYEEMKDPEAGEQLTFDHRRQGTLSRISARLDSLQDASHLSGLVSRAIRVHNNPSDGDVLTTEELRASIPIFTAAARRLRFTEKVVKEIEQRLTDKANGIAPTGQAEDLTVEPIKFRELIYDFEIAKPEAMDRMVMTAVQSFRSGHITRAELAELCSKHCPEDATRGAACGYLGQIERCESPEEVSQCVTAVNAAMQTGQIGRDVGRSLANLGQVLIDKMKTKETEHDSK